MDGAAGDLALSCHTNWMEKAGFLRMTKREEAACRSSSYVVYGKEGLKLKRVGT